MTKIQTEDAIFGFRAARIIVNDGRILLYKTELDDFWMLVGGCVNLFEFSEDALKREFLEEAGIKISVDRLLWVVEHVFASELDNKKTHSLELLFLASPEDSEEKFMQDEFYGQEEDFNPEKYGKIKLTFRWFKPSELDDLTIYPEFLKEALKKIPEHPVHIRTFE